MVEAFDHFECKNILYPLYWCQARKWHIDYVRSVGPFLLCVLEDASSLHKTRLGDGDGTMPLKIPLYCSMRVSSPIKRGV